MDDSGVPPSLMVDGQVPGKDKKSPKEKTELEIALDGYELGGYQGEYSFPIHSSVLFVNFNADIKENVFC